VAREDPEYVRARQPVSVLSIGEGRALSIRICCMAVAAALKKCLRLAKCSPPSPAIFSQASCTSAVG
jgi:hypothetical protein